MKTEFSIKTAGTESDKNPSTNTLVPCPYCYPKTRGIWRYNFLQHLKDEHPTVDRSELRDDWLVTEGEKEAMKDIWDKHKKFKKRKIKKNLAGLAVSEAHTAGMSTRYDVLEYLRYSMLIIE